MNGYYVYTDKSAVRKHKAIYKDERRMNRVISLHMDTLQAWSFTLCLRILSLT